MDSVVDWFARLGLARYAQRFVDNDIDFAVLPGLTDADLKELGVASLGHRRKLLAAVAELRAQPPVDVLPPSADAAERRQLSVMFCDLVGSTALSARLDPEEMRRVIAEFHAACAPVIADYEGTIAKFMGDGILAYFGYPHAHEDDAERAVRAGLAIGSAVARLETPAREPVHARIGIATGLVVVGDRIGEGSAREEAVVGDAPNLAARLQALAEPGRIVIAPSTRRLIGDVFQLRSLGQHALKGFTEPVEAFAVDGIANMESRFEASHARRLSAFIGREKECAVLLDRLGTAWHGDGQMVLISGEAGIGKSRFLAWLIEHVSHQPHTRMRYQCSPYHSQSALYPVIQQFIRSADMHMGEPAASQLVKLEGVLARATPRVKDVAPLIASLLSIPFEGHYPPLGMSPAQQRRLTLSALLEQLEGLARQSPVLVLLEDVHWADATSLELVNLAVERLRKLPILFLITFRPEFEPPWQGLENVTRIDLGRLDSREVEALVGRMTGGRALPVEVVKQIVDKTDGVPLFVEELTKTIEESGLLVAEEGRYRLDGPLPPLAIPSTLQDSLMARLDRLSPLKEIVQTGAAIGREFSFAMLEAVSRQDRATLVSALAQLEQAELVFRAGVPPDSHYTFKHALVQDAAYESLLRSRRQPLHRRIAEALSGNFPALAEAEPEVVAHHYTEAGNVAQAIDWWRKAGEFADRRAAYTEAAQHWKRAIDLADELAPDDLSPARRLGLQIAYGQALILARGWSAPEAIAAFVRAREIAASVADPAERMTAYYGLWGSAHARGDPSAPEVAAAFLSDVLQQPGVPEEGVAHRAVASSSWYGGNYERASEHIENAIACYRRHPEAVPPQRYGQEVGAAAAATSALVLWPLGRFDRAQELAGTALHIATQSGHAATLCFVRYHLCMFERIRGAEELAVDHAEALHEIAGKNQMPVWRIGGEFLHGWVQCRRQPGEQALKDMRESMAAYRQLGMAIYLPFWGLTLADAEAAVKGSDAALARLDRTLADSAQVKQHWLDAALLMRRGDCLLDANLSDPAAVEAAYRTAIAVARSQRTKAFELRAALKLARLLGERDAEAKALVATAAEGLLPSPSFPESREAAVLLQSA